MSEWPNGNKDRYLYPIPIPNTYNLVLNKYHRMSLSQDQKKLWPIGQFSFVITSLMKFEYICGRINVIQVPLSLKEVSKFQALCRFIIASQAHNLCKSSQGLTLSTVSLVLNLNVIFKLYGVILYFFGTRVFIKILLCIQTSMIL